MMQVDLLHDVLRMRVPELNGVVDIEWAAEDQAFEGMPADRVHSVDMLWKFPVESRDWSYFVLADVDDEALVIAHSAYYLSLEGRKTDVEDSFVCGLDTVGLDIVNVRSFGEIHIREYSFFIRS